ncbi:MAG: hypothetical protein K2H68_00670 [Bacteroidales bacterium]|nr:hypothetical protein [Bacteroidales bacterium]
MGDKDTNKPRAEPNLFGLSLGIGKGQARLDDAETEGQSQAILLGSAEAEYLQRSASEAKDTTNYFCDLQKFL